MHRASKFISAVTLLIALLVGLVAVPAFAQEAEQSSAPQVQSHDGDKDRIRHHRPRLFAFGLAKCLPSRHGKDGKVGVVVVLKTADRAPAFRGVVKVDGLRPELVRLRAGGDTEREFFVVRGAGDGRPIRWAVLGKFTWRERIVLPPAPHKPAETEQVEVVQTQDATQTAPVEEPKEETKPEVKPVEPKPEPKPRVIWKHRSHFVKRFGIVRALCAKPVVWAKTWCDPKTGKQLVAWTIFNPTRHPMVIRFTRPRLDLRGTVVGGGAKVTRLQKLDGTARKAGLLVGVSFDRHGKHLRLAGRLVRLPGDCKCKDDQPRTHPGTKPGGVGKPPIKGDTVLIAAPAASLQDDVAGISSSDEGALPFTGSSTYLLAAFGSALLLLGASVLIVRRFTRQ